MLAMSACRFMFLLFATKIFFPFSRALLLSTPVSLVFKNGGIFVLEGPYPCQGGILALGAIGCRGLSDWSIPSGCQTHSLIGHLLVVGTRFARISFA